MDIQESGENYLETILLLQNRNENVRSIDVANELGYSRASISRAMNILKKSEYIEIDVNGNINLTEKGNKKANEIYDRHKVITNYLVSSLKIDWETANRDACKIEHFISDETFEAMKRIVLKEGMD